MNPDETTDIVPTTEDTPLPEPSSSKREDDKIFADSLSQSSKDLHALLKAQFSPSDYEKIRTVGALMGYGLSLSECCILAHVEKSVFDELLERNKDVAAFILFKETSYKARLLQVIAQKAFSGADKNAGWLLERKFPKEYNPKDGDRDRTPGDNLLEKGINFVRKNGDREPLIVQIKDVTQKEAHVA